MAVFIFLGLLVACSYIVGAITKKRPPAHLRPLDQHVSKLPSGGAGASVSLDLPDTSKVWTDYDIQLKAFEEELKNFTYGPMLTSLHDNSEQKAVDKNRWEEWHILRSLPENGILATQVRQLLAKDELDPPHGVQILELPKVPELPEFPAPPTCTAPTNCEHIVKKLEKIRLRYQTIEEEFTAFQHRDLKKLSALRNGIASGSAWALCELVQIEHCVHAYPKALHGALVVNFDENAKVLLCELSVPDFSKIRTVRPVGRSFDIKCVDVSATERRRLLEVILCSLCLRTAYLASMSDYRKKFETVAINILQTWHDPATGSLKEGVVASLQTSREKVLELELDRVDPKECFRHLKGLMTPSLAHVSAIRPIFILDKNDNRIIENKEVADQISEDANLATMPWDDFEHLVRQLFEWEFGKNGVEIKVTRASRDRGVDAIMFDPDPFKGGKFVLQAKRYTRTVDVAAVRDLYGTVINEGANRGILVTTSTYGPDSYEFAKDKPLSLVDGSNLLALLVKHGRSFKIDLTEARTEQASRNSR